MNRSAQLKGLMTKTWNKGKYVSEEDFKSHFNEDFIQKYNIMHYELVDVLAYIPIVCNKPPKMLAPQKKEHKKWYVYFYFLKDQLNTPIYIGKTYDVGNRLQQHIKEEKKYKQVKYVLCCVFETENDALDFEAYYTRYLQPEWNIDNREPPSKLYKLPVQELKPWAPSTTLEDPQYHQIFKDVEFMRSTLIPNFQKTINAISA